MEESTEGAVEYRKMPENQNRPVRLLEDAASVTIQCFAPNCWRRSLRPS